MKFRFCGGQDCPDWLLAEISLLTKVSSVKIKLVASHIIKYLLGETLDYAKLERLTSDAKYGSGDLETLLASLRFIFTSAARFDVDSTTLSDELQQLGLPKEHSASLCKAYDGTIDGLQARLREDSLRLWQLKEYDWRVDYIFGTSQTQVHEPRLLLQLKTLNGVSDSADATKSSTVSMTREQLEVLISELKKAREQLAALRAEH